MIMDASVHNADFTEVECERRLPASGRERYGPTDTVELYRDCATHLTFIGAVVVRKELLDVSRTRALLRKRVHSLRRALSGADSRANHRYPRAARQNSILARVVTGTSTASNS